MGLASRLGLVRLEGRDPERKLRPGLVFGRGNEVATPFGRDLGQAAWECRDQCTPA